MSFKFSFARISETRKKDFGNIHIYEVGIKPVYVVNYMLFGHIHDCIIIGVVMQ